MALISSRPRCVKIQIEIACKMLICVLVHLESYKKGPNGIWLKSRCETSTNHLLFLNHFGDRYGQFLLTH